MKKINIPDTDLELSAIGFGTLNAGLAWDGEAAVRILEKYVGCGGNVIDTAHIYSDWIPGEKARAERVIGQWIKGRKRRQDIILMTKGGHPRLEAMEASRLSKEEMAGDLDASLRKLCTDYIDIYFYHRDDPGHSVEELVETMESFRKAGKIRYYACSNWKVKRMEEADRYCREKGYRGFVANQAMYNIGARSARPMSDPTMLACGQEMLAYHARSNNLLMPYRGICGGFFHSFAEKGEDGVKESCFYTKDNVNLAKEIKALCIKKGYGMTQVLLGFFAVQDIPMLPLAGADNEQQLKELILTLGTEFDARDYEFCR
ncbi:MAG: aldo/keto reductase [Lachnospiraceae bacterium]|jgi:aryl-alcohol dehydrogenase-like predicted oxidoreductase|nr:aldo/keto reductase [Lachnospiraceae bacterium]